MAGNRGINPKRQTNQFLLPSSSEWPDGRPKCYAPIRARPRLAADAGRCVRGRRGGHAEHGGIFVGRMRRRTGSAGRRQSGGAARILERAVGVESQRRGKQRNSENYIKCERLCERGYYVKLIECFLALKIPSVLFMWFYFSCECAFKSTFLTPFFHNYTLWRILRMFYFMAKQWFGFKYIYFDDSSWQSILFSFILYEYVEIKKMYYNKFSKYTIFVHKQFGGSA